MKRADGEACYLSIAFPKIVICTKALESVSWMHREGPKGCRERIRTNAECNGRLILSGQSHLFYQSSLVNIL
jgi:hypothetical protein